MKAHENSNYSIETTTLNIPGIGEVEIPKPPRGEGLDYYLVDPATLSTRERIRRSIRQICNTEKTDTEFAEKLDTQSSYVSNWMRGKCTPELETLERISHTFNVSLDDIFAGTACTNAYASQQSTESADSDESAEATE